MLGFMRTTQLFRCVAEAIPGGAPKVSQRIQNSAIPHYNLTVCKTGLRVSKIKIWK